MRSLLCVMLLMVAGSAWATVGGDDRLEVLGYEPVDGKLYWLLHRGGEVGGPPRLHFLALQGERPGQAQAVSSWYQGDQRAAERAFPERLAALQARLKATPAADLAGARLTVTHQDLRVCADAAKQPRTGDEARALVARWQAGDPDLDSPVCRLLGLQVAWGDFTGETWAEAWGGASLLSVRALPDARYALAVVRFVGQHFESGYAVERP
ncbi:MAG: hypothetical protein KC613_04735, partial [Myxococcales bacterium]|nr:hypothetical protein [Myxococcales bacterium]